LCLCFTTNHFSRRKCKGVESVANAIIQLLLCHYHVCIPGKKPLQLPASAAQFCLKTSITHKHRRKRSRMEILSFNDDVNLQQTVRCALTTRTSATLAPSETWLNCGCNFLLLLLWVYLCRRRFGSVRFGNISPVFHVCRSMSHRRIKVRAGTFVPPV
jgi:hypothetical protein